MSLAPPSRGEVAAVFEEVLQQAPSIIAAARWTVDGFREHVLAGGGTMEEADEVAAGAVELVASLVVALVVAGLQVAHE